MKKVLISSSLALSIILSGCATSSSQIHYVNPEKEGVAAPQTLGLSYEDINRAAQKLINSMLKSPYLNRMYEIKMKKEGKPLVIMISDFTNDTTQRLDIDQIVKQIKIALLNSGKFIFTTAVRAGGPEDRATYELRKLRKNKEFNQNTIAKKGTIIAPDLSLSGKIIQRTTILQNGEERVDYYIQMTLTDVTSGLAFWEGEQVISKIGKSDITPW